MTAREKDLLRKVWNGATNLYYDLVQDHELDIIDYEKEGKGYAVQNLKGMIAGNGEFYREFTKYIERLVDNDKDKD